MLHRYKPYTYHMKQSNSITTSVFTERTGNKLCLQIFKSIVTMLLSNKYSQFQNAKM